MNLGLLGVSLGSMEGVDQGDGGTEVLRTWAGSPIPPVE